jgi:hypothetical protein
MRHKRIPVTVRADGRTFVGNVEVTIEKPKDWPCPPPWALSQETALGLGLATSETYARHGEQSCGCKPGWRATCTEGERQGKPCETRTSIWRHDRKIRLHGCRMCRGLYIGHYTTHLCSEACIAANAVAWREAHRYPAIHRPPSKAAQRREALASARCQTCGEPFTPQRVSAKFCSNRCRQANHRIGRAPARPPAPFPSLTHLTQ